MEAPPPSAASADVLRLPEGPHRVRSEDRGVTLCGFLRGGSANVDSQA